MKRARIDHPPPEGGRAGEGGKLRTAVKQARRLRHKATATEAILWRWLRKHRMEGLHFRRQHPIGPYIVDFCCVPRRLVVELDGYVHTDPLRAERDALRTRWLMHQGYRVCRFRNEQVWAGPELVLGEIADALAGRAPPSLTLPPPGGGNDPFRRGAGI